MTQIGGAGVRLRSAVWMTIGESELSSWEYILANGFNCPPYAFSQR